MRISPSLSSRLLHSLFVLGVLLGASLALPACDKDKPAQPPQEKPALRAPTLRLYALAGAAGAIEPCGCVKDMLGGVDHAAAWINSQEKQAPNSLVVGAGPMFFADPTLDAEGKEQATFKADTMAASLHDVGLAAWAPGANDWADGMAKFGELEKKSGARALAANIDPQSTPVQSSFVVERGGIKVGLVGISIPKLSDGSSKVATKDAAGALKAGVAEAKKAGAEIFIALIAAARGEALRLVENESAFQIAVIGKPFDQGDSNDPPYDPEVIGHTLVVQAPNHLQGVSVVDLYVRDEKHQFADGSGLSVVATRTSLKSRVSELEERIANWKRPDSGVRPEDLAAREKELVRLRGELKNLKAPEIPKKGSFFLYDLIEVRESHGKDERVASRLEAYYKQVNEYNQKAYADLKPRPAGDGEASYMGGAACANCHLEEKAFWDTTRHAGAYETLSSDHKEFNLDCVSCHVTGYDKPGGSTVTHVENLTDVQCEVCHGPGSRHIDNPADKSAIQRAPAKTMCASACHHPPHVGKTWSVEEAWPHILGKGHGLD